MRKIRAAGRDVGLHEHTTELEIKKKFEFDLRGFLQYYFPEQFYLEFSPDHLEAIDIIQDGILHGGQFAYAMPRGSGKTTIARGAIIWAICYGHRRYIVPIASTQGDAEKLISAIKATFEFNEKLLAVFPEICHYIRALEGQTQRAAGQVADGKLTKITWKSSLLVFPNFEKNEEYLERGAQSVIEARGLTGGIRGLQQTTAQGETLRPDFVFLDDPQTKESAKSPTQTADREELIQADVLGLAGVGKKLAGIMTCTIIAEDDLADRFLKKWRSKKAKLIYVLPEQHDKLWREYIALRKDNKDLAELEKQKICNDFYLANREAMDKGAVVGWEKRVNEGDISALQTAYNLLADVGEMAFFSEYQNDPIKENPNIYSITSSLLMSRKNGLKKHEIAKDAHFKILATDINYYGLSWTHVNFRNDYAGFVADYGIWPQGDVIYDNSWNMSEEAAIYEALKNYTDWVSSSIKDLSILGIDGNRFTDSVYKFIAQFANSYPFRIVALRGMSNKQYKEPRHNDKRLIGSAKTRCHVRASDRGIHDVPFDSYFWHMTMQKAFLRSPGAPGACSFYGNNSTNHREISEQICADRLIDYYERHGEYIYDWRTIGKNDLGDALTMCYVLANISGAELDGVKIKKSTKKKRRRAHVQNFNR